MKQFIYFIFAVITATGAIIILNADLSFNVTTSLVTVLTIIFSAFMICHVNYMNHLNDQIDKFDKNN